MSAAATVIDPDDDAGTTPETNDIEARARLMGWRPLDEYKGAPSTWKTAEEYVRRGETDLPLIRDHNRKLEARVLSMERAVQESAETLKHMTDIVRSSDERAMKKALAKLEEERQAAVASGDTQAFNRTEREIKDIQDSRPKPPEKTAAPTQGATPPETLAFVARNPWFNADPELRQEAIALHGALLQSSPGLTLEENLARVEAKVKAANPDKFRTATPDPDPDAEPGENPRRQAASAVAPSTSARAQIRPKPRSFEAMPEESRKAFSRYKEQLKGKGDPLTEKEWAETYWSQFEDA